MSAWEDTLPRRETAISLVLSTLLFVGCTSSSAVWKKTNPPDSIRVPMEWDIPEVDCPGLVLPTVVHHQGARPPNTFGETTPRGRVILSGVVNADGSVSDVKPFAADDGRLIGPAVAAFRMWRFKPARCGETAVAIGLKMAFYFNVPPPPKAAGSRPDGG